MRWQFQPRSKPWALVALKNTLAMNKLAVLSLTCILSSLLANSQSLQFKPSFGVAFDSSFGSTLINQCSRSFPDSVNGFWNLTSNEILRLETKFKLVKSITAKDCCLIGGKVTSVKTFGFQYFGVFVNGQPFIYINAFTLTDVEDLKARGFDPALYPVLVCDGGDYYWGVLFDLERNEFSHLAFNVASPGG
jgi:hypothetical protein